MAFNPTILHLNILLISYRHDEFPTFPFPPGSKGQGLITNWGPAAFSDVELSHREKQWQKMKNEKSQAQ